MQEVGTALPSAAAGEQPNFSPAGSPEPGMPGRRMTGPQNWYAQAHGLPAEQLPKGDVGPLQLLICIRPAAQSDAGMGKAMHASVSSCICYWLLQEVR
jgi:hypothetical protein